MLDGAARRSARPPAVTADLDGAGAGLGHACCHDSDACFGDQLYVDACSRIELLQVVNQLGNIFNAVNVVMRRWRYQSDAGLGMPQARDVIDDLLGRQLAPFARLGSLSDLDLKLGCGDQVFRSHTKSS